MNPVLKITLIAAFDRNRVMGRSRGGLPWHIPEESAMYRARTAGHWVLLGRVTFEEMDGWFSTQRPVVLTTQAGYRPHSGAQVAADIPQALRLIQSIDPDAGEVIVLGGAAVFDAALPFATDMILSRIDTEVEGDRYFPRWDPLAWALISESDFPVTGTRPIGWTVRHYRRSAMERNDGKAG